MIGTLTATDIDTADNELTFTTTSTDFKIVNNNELRTKHPLTTTALSMLPSPLATALGVLIKPLLSK
ncbi:hypothetical protein BSPWISOXPB_2555 [uncultured Gammaproteobacteria bacterium]|nr:hypothetical protein BSPWISOXPB_2555 [uncultured Gammaproteobacteria bacterium]